MPATIVHDTFALERTYAKPLAKVFAALADPAKKKRWFAGESVETFEMEFRAGGIEHVATRMGASTPFPGTLLESRGRYETIVENRHVVLSTTMELGGRPISSALISFELEEQSGTTRLILTHQAAFYEGADGPEMRRGGWEQLLDQLTAFLED